MNLKIAKVNQMDIENGTKDSAKNTKKKIVLDEDAQAIKNNLILSKDGIITSLIKLLKSFITLTIKNKFLNGKTTDNSELMLYYFTEIRPMVYKNYVASLLLRIIEEKGYCSYDLLLRYIDKSNIEEHMKRNVVKWCNTHKTLVNKMLY